MCQLPIPIDEKGNREYKDSAFRLLFGNESSSAELYNAINGTNYPASAITMKTIQTPLFYSGFRNDIAFVIGDKIVVLHEHQSTISPSMPIRCLWYVAEVYEQLIDIKGIYGKKPNKIATPEFIVFYNGTAGYPEKTTLKLSDLFKVKDGREINLEVIVTVYNINKGYNKKLMKHSKTLNDYALFIAKVRKYIQSGLELARALQSGVEYCIRNNILREFLEQNGGEIVSILRREWNLDDAKQVWEEETREEIAENLFKIGLSIEQIAESTALPLEKVLELQENRNQLRD
jgi:hypothetical protein